MPYFLCVCFLCMYYLCEKYYKSIAIQNYLANCVSWMPMKKLNLRTYCRNRTHPHIGDLLYSRVSLWGQVEATCSETCTSNLTFLGLFPCPPSPALLLVSPENTA